jgi:hypothetical protein
VSARRYDRPEPGFYKRRLVSGGPWVAVRFFHSDDEIHVEVDGCTHRADGSPYDPFDEWALSWPSSESEHRFFTQLREWAERHAPHHPAANPRRRIDLTRMPPRSRP